MYNSPSVAYTMHRIFDLSSVKYKYPESHRSAGEWVLNDLDLKIEAGEFIAIIGPNGSGKSTLARILNALLIPVEGRILINGMDSRDLQNLLPIRNQVGMVFQFPEDQIVSTLVDEDVAFGPANLGLPREEIRKRVTKALEQVGLSDQRMRAPHMLSAGQVQRLALAGVLALNPRCIVFDEATTMLDPLGRKKVMQIMHELNSVGVTIVFITHHMEEAAQAKRIIVMDHGQIVMDGDPRSVFIHGADLQSMGLSLPPVTDLANLLRQIFPSISEGIFQENDLMVELGSLQKRSGFGMPKPTTRSAPVQIDVAHLAHTYLKGTPLEHLAIRDVSFQIQQSASYGFMGHTGSGKSTVLQHLNAILHPQAGTVRVGEFNLGDPNVDRKNVCRLAGLLLQNPEMQFFETYVGDEIAYGVRQFGTEEKIADRVRWAMEWAGLDFEKMKDRPVFSLSGGEKRKVALASVRAWKPGILLLDEPTAGLDPKSRNEILNRLKLLRDEAVTVVLSSHQMEDIAELADGAVVFDQGCDISNGPIGAVFLQGNILDQAGLEPPLAGRVASFLRRSGWQIPDWVVKSEDLALVLGAQFG